MKRILRLNRTCRRVMPVTLMEVKVQVTQNRMILRLRWWLMLNNMSSCNVLTQRWVKTSLAKMILLRDGHWQGYPSRCRHVWITSIACWRDAAGKYKPHVLHPLNHSPPYTNWRNVWLWSWLFTWPKRSPLFSERSWHTRPRSCTMTVLCIYYAPITGYSRFTRNYCTHRPAAMPPGNVKENDPAVAWYGLQHMPNHPNSGGRRLLARASVTGLEVPVRRIPYRYGFLPTGPQWFCNSCRRRRTNTGQSTRLGWMDEEVAPADIPKQWQEARANRRMQFKVGNYRDGSGESNIRLLTGTIKADWIQLPVEQYLAALPTLKQGVIAGVFRQKGAGPLGDYQRGEVATLSLPCQWTVFGGLVCRGLWLTNCLAGSLHDGGWSSSQGCWLWLSRLEEKVWC